MSGFHTATLCADCDPPVVAISTGYGSRCPRCGQMDESGGPLRHSASPFDGALARQIITSTAIRSDGDAFLLAELARRLLDRVGKDGEACATADSVAGDDVDLSAALAGRHERP